LRHLARPVAVRRRTALLPRRGGPDVDRGLHRGEGRADVLPGHPAVVDAGLRGRRRRHPRPERRLLDVRRRRRDRHLQGLREGPAGLELPVLADVGGGAGRGAGQEPRRGVALRPRRQQVRRVGPAPGDDQRGGRGGGDPGGDQLPAGVQRDQQPVAHARARRGARHRGRSRQEQRRDHRGAVAAMTSSTLTGPAAPAAPVRHRPVGRALQGWLYATPTAAFVGVLFVLPLLLVMLMSASRWPLLSGYQGWNLPANYSRAVSNRFFVDSVVFTVKYTVLATVLLIALGLGLALLVQESTRWKGLRRTAFLVPSALGLASASLLFYVLYSPFAGPFAPIMERMGATFL